MNPDKSLASGIERLRLGRLGEALRGIDAYLVGGAARSLVAGVEPDGDVDIAVDGDLDALLDIVEGEVARRHVRFATATVPLDHERHADLARTRTETYPAPGALPVVVPAPIEEDLARRDFSINAIAISLAPPHRIIDPFGGSADLASGRLRILHPGSFNDDPTRAIRAARYCARLRLRPDEETLALLRSTELSLLSRDRRNSELARLAGEADAAAGFRLLAEWGVLPLSSLSLGLIATIDETLDTPAWRAERWTREAAILLAADGGEELTAALSLADEHPARPSDAVALATGVRPPALLLAAAAGADWVDEYIGDWRQVVLEIGGADLIAAGIEPGPRVGAGLRGALEEKLNGELQAGREQELDAALRIAREAI
jgi:tRNA nucleotidyltransferase (CCA-adding enzyme)